MAPDNFTGGKAVCGAVEKSKSEAEEIIIRINDKINSLYSVLRPICLDNATPEVINEQSSPLIQKLSGIEHKISGLLSSIRI